MRTFNDRFLEEFDNWEIMGINIGTAIRKQIIPDKLPEVEVSDQVVEAGQILLYTKPYCPDCEEVAYSGKYCSHCGRRLRK